MTDDVAVATTPLDQLELSVRSYQALRRSNVATVEALTAMSKAELRALPNIGVLSVREIEDALRSREPEEVQVRPRPLPRPRPRRADRPLPRHFVETIRPLRRDGVTYREIGERCDPPISGQRVRQLWEQHASDDDRAAFEKRSR